MRRMKLNDYDKRFRKEHHLKFIMNMRWAKLTRGEKLVRVAVKLTRFALIAAVIAVVASIIIGAVLGLIVAFAMASAISGGLRNAGRANTNHLYGMYKWQAQKPPFMVQYSITKGGFFHAGEDLPEIHPAGCSAGKYHRKKSGFCPLSLLHFFYSSTAFQTCSFYLSYIGGSPIRAYLSTGFPRTPS